jgi:hypothetical protein
VLRCLWVNLERTYRSGIALVCLCADFAQRYGSATAVRRKTEWRTKSMKRGIIERNAALSGRCLWAWKEWNGGWRTRNEIVDPSAPRSEPGHICQLYSAPLSEGKIGPEDSRVSIPAVHWKLPTLSKIVLWAQRLACFNYPISLEIQGHFPK